MSYVCAGKSFKSLSEAKAYAQSVFVELGMVAGIEAKKPKAVRIIFNKLLGGWYVVRGPHQAPLGGRFDSKAEAQAWLDRLNK